LAGFEVPDRFYEIGSPQGRAELEALLHEQRSEPGPTVSGRSHGGRG